MQAIGRAACLEATVESAPAAANEVRALGGERYSRSTA